MIPILVLMFFLPLIASAQEYTCMVYFTGVGCPHCAKTDPVVLETKLQEHPEVVMIEYEIYQKQDNAAVFYTYGSEFETGYGIPMLLIKRGSYIRGDIPILDGIDDAINSNTGNRCMLIDGSSADFQELDIASLPGIPSLWKGDRILMNAGGGNNNGLLRSLLYGDVSSVLEGEDYEIIDPEPVPLSGSTVEFENAVYFDGWIFQWNGQPVENSSQSSNGSNGQASSSNNGTNIDEKELSFAKIIGLAAVDAVNPCAFAVLSLMLIAIITYNPENRRNILLAGFAFVLSVFVMYMFYGLVIIRFFQLIQALTSIRLILYQMLGFAAIILGILNIKDFFRYKPGGLGTEMPMRLRPRVKKIISGITSPKGAFIVGAFVTVFLLPCTIGPYVIAGGILSAIDLIATIPWLLIYNAIFVIPMIAITFIVYRGMASIDNVSEWKDKNIKYLHLVAGVIIMLLGLGMVLGLV